MIPGLVLDFSAAGSYRMASRLFYLFVIAALAAAPALAEDKDDTGLAPVPSALKDEGPEEPPDESRIQIPEMPQQHPGEKPAHAETHDHAHDKPHEGMKEETYGPVTLGAILEPEGNVEKGKEAAFMLTLLKKDSQPAAPDDLVERHTKKLHLLIVDESLDDYQHLHPESDGNRWRFSFTPKTAHNYKIWVDVQLKGEAPQMMPILLMGAEPCKENCVDGKPVAAAKFGGNDAQLSFAKELVAGVPAEGKFALVSADGKTLENLEPVMGAYAHIAAFTADFGSVAHVHPMGKAPEKDGDRGAAPVSFMLHPEKAGVLKLFVQIRVDGKDVFLPFTATVAEPDPVAMHVTPPEK